MKKIVSSIIIYTRRLNISTRLISCFFLVSILPLLIITVYLCSTYSSAMTDKLGRTNHTALLQISKTIDATLEDYQYLAGKLSIDPLVQDFLTSETTLSEKDSETLSLHMNYLINETIVYPPYVKTLKILDNNGSFVYDMGYDDISAADYRNIMENVNLQKPNSDWSYIKTFMGQDIIILGHRINSTQNMNNALGYTLLFISEQIFTKNILAGVDPDTLSTLVILTPDGTVLTSNRKEIERNEPFYNHDILNAILSQETEKTPDDYFIYESKENSCLVVYTKNKALDSYLISCIPLSYVRGEAYKIIPAVALFILLIVGICILFGILLYSTIMRPIKDAVKTCEDIQMERLSSRITIDADDELAFLSSNINQMLDKNQLLLALNKENEERKRILEIQMLRYQINPHFLFNTLSTLKWIAELNQVPMLEDMITSLSEILKSTLINPEEYVCLAEEIRILNYYIQIQKVRYIHKFEVQYDLPAELHSFKIPHFILQPLVENAIYHGTYNDGRMILIQISALRADKHVHLLISDNGKGFSPDDLHKKTAPDHASIGIQNVRERISRIYNGLGDFLIESTPEKGTRCTIVIPCSDQ